MTYLKVASASALALSVIGCSGEKLGFPRTPVSAASPDGRYVAVVRNHPSIDPPNQRLWVGDRDGALQRLKQLGEDVAWSNLLVWSADSSTVSFLVQDAELVTVDARSRQIISEHRLADSEAGYPTALMVKDLSLSSDGRHARFRQCRRPDSRSDFVHDAVDCGPLATKAIR